MSNPPNPFPALYLEIDGVDANPAVRLFGRRFFSDQTTLELLVELLLVAASPKKVGGKPFSDFFPPLEILNSQWTDTPLSYAPRARLNLKLFAFFGASKLDTRHETHRKHLEQLDEALRNHMSISDDTPDNVLKTLENLFLGFHGVGTQRTWCAQSFLPVCRSTVSCESIWKQTKGKNVGDWTEALNYFSHRQALFLARGGEVLYLQLCNALRQEPHKIENWLEANGLADFLTSEEKNPAWLHAELENALGNLMKETPATVSRIAEFIDRGVEGDTAKQTDEVAGSPRWTKCGWCPEETWPESYLFAVELLRICRATLDLMDRLELLETLCALHVMRSLTTQAARYSCNAASRTWPACRLAMTDIDGSNRTVKQVSRATVQAVSKTIFDGLRHPDIISQTPKNERTQLYRDADRRYGHKLFITLGKRIGMIVPRRGAGMRFVLNTRLLRLLIISLLPRRQMTYETFKLAAESHFGIVFDEAAIGRANSWATGMSTSSFGGATDEWLGRMLEEAGALRRLSDSCAIVENNAVLKNQEKTL